MGGESGKMEGWLYLIRSNRIGLQYSRKRYFVLEDHVLKSFKSIPLSTDQDPVRSAIIDSCIRVTDNGRESIQRTVFFIFTVYNTSDHGDQLKLGARSPDEAARWMRCFQEAVLQQDQHQVTTDCSWSEAQPMRLHCSSRSRHLNSFEWNIRSSIARDAVASDVVAPSQWTIFSYQKGLRLFKEAKDTGFVGNWDDHPAIMAVGVVDGSSEVIFETLMSLGPSRSEWDFCFYKGSIIEHLDGHNDIVHLLLHRDWLPWGMRPRDLLLRRYWRRDDDGTYVILYHSVIHQRCPTQKGYVRASVRNGGFIVSPVHAGNESVVKHMLAIDWKSWTSCLHASSTRSITISMLGRLAALREMFRAKAGELMRERSLQQSAEDVKLEVQTKHESGRSMGILEEEEAVKTPSEYGSLVALSEATDEFFDIPEPLDYDFGTDIYYQDTRHPKLSTTVLAKRLHDLTAPRRGHVNEHEMARADALSCNYGFTLPQDPSCNLHCSWTTADPSEFEIRGKTYLEDHKKIKANGTLMQMVAADWLESDKREDNLAGRPGSIVQTYAARDSPEFFFIVNIQFPGATTHSLALYYMMSTPVEDAPLLDKFIKGDDAYRNSRFKIMPWIPNGPWIVRQTVGKKASLIGQALEVNYFHGRNYFEIDVDVGSSMVARRVAGYVIGYLNNAVLEIAFLIQGNTPEELPEFLLGTCRLNHLDPSKSIPLRRKLREFSTA